MKKIILASLIVGTAFLVGCKDDNDSNPTLQTPSSSEFVLNEPALAGNTYDLANTDGITLTWSQPPYGYTAAVQYYAQVSLENDFTEVAAGHQAKYAEVEGAATTCKYTFPSNLVDAALLKAGLIDEPGKLPYLTDLYVRLRATVGAGDKLYSNVVKLKVKPYYQELSSDPVLWYLVGDNIGNGSEENKSLWNVGVSLVPLSAVNGAKYNFNGDGELSITDYFAAGKFRLLKTPGEKDDTNFFGSTDGTAATGAIGNTGYFNITTAGYYKVTFNSKTSEFSYEPVADADKPAEYTSISLPGTINGWNQTGNHFVKANEHNGVNHVWYFDYEFAVNDEIKMAANDSWDINWGSEDFPYGFGVGNGKNIKVTQKGKYRVLFNDVTGFYSFITLPKE